MAEWVVLELTPKGEKEDPDTIRRSITRVLRNAEVYIPAVQTQIGDERVVHYLMHGYAFVKKDRPDADYFKLENGKFIETVLVASGVYSSRKVGTVNEDYIEDMREKIRAEVNQGIGVGDIVRICSGPYKNIEATVITEIPEKKQVQVHVHLRSKEAILTLPRSVLDIVDRAPLSSYFARLGYLRSWAQMAQVVLKYKGSHERMRKTLEKYQRISAWLHEWKTLFVYIHSYSEFLTNCEGKLGEKVERLERVAQWLEEGRRLYSFVFFKEVLPPQGLAIIEQKYERLLWFQGVDDRLHALSQEVEEIARAMARKRKGVGEMVFQNVMIDGHNLAFRCFYAPGMNLLKDAQGRPTGIILGFLKSLGALKKRYPEANFWVSWDGSSRRRKAKYPDYKGNRKYNDEQPSFDQLGFLRETLPLLGVTQVWNPEEEADDVIATLTRGELAAQHNLLFSTDRDFLQLVTESTMLLVPALGSRKEILFDVEAVKNVMGVPPGKVLQMRAFFGDTSDNLPGVPRVPKKIIKSLVQAYNSVDGVYSSGLAGVSKGQYERLRSAEPQVRINLDLMALVAVDVVRLNPDVNVNEAANRLSGVSIKPGPVIDAIFGSQALESSTT